MSNIKRNFNQYSSEVKTSFVPSGLAKRLKIHLEPNIKVYTRFRPAKNEDFTGNVVICIVECLLIELVLKTRVLLTIIIRNLIYRHWTTHNFVIYLNINY